MAPWDLASAPLVWMDMAENAQAAEAAADKHRQEKRAKAPAGRGTRRR